MDIVRKFNQLEFVKSQLAHYSGIKKESATTVMIQCPFHSDRTPSGAINIGEKYPPGRFSCFGCKHVATWNELAVKLGLKPFGRDKPKDEHANGLVMAPLYLDNEYDGYKKDKLRFYNLPPNKKWRGIPTNLLIELNGRLCQRWFPEYGTWGTTKFIYFPVDIFDETRGYFLARLRKDTSEKKLPSYLLAKTNGDIGWSITYGLWPFNYAIEKMKFLNNKYGISNRICLVEGQRDALRLLLNGIPAVCIFGTKSWSDKKSHLLEIGGVERIYTMFDGDCAGIEATEKIVPRLEPYFETISFKLWNTPNSPYYKYRKYPEPTKKAKEHNIELWDPGNIPQEILNKYKQKFLKD